MKIRKSIAVILLIGVLVSGVAIIYSETIAILDTKNNRIEELQDNIKGVQQELESEINKVKQLEEDKEAIQKELDAKTIRLKQFEAILSSSVIKLTLEELDLFFRLVEAEAGNENMRGKIAVANVVINRVKDTRFPDTVKEVIYQPYQFQPIINGHINKTPSSDSKKAVLRALKGEQVVSSDTISFWATYLNSSHELWRLPITNRIGIHVFTNKF